MNDIIKCPPNLTRWQRFCWYVGEINKVFSDQPSFYSGKRLKDWVAFVTGEYILIHGFIYLLMRDKLDDTGIALIAGVAFTIAGYQLNKIQQEKKDEKTPE
jgi:hypothetical protein